MPSPVQFDIFGGSTVYGAPRVFALPMAPIECPHCGDHEIPTRGTDTYESSRLENPSGHGWTSVTAYAGHHLYWRRPVTQWLACCERECGTCDLIMSERFDRYACEACDTCNECCECHYCESCDRMRDSYNSCCEACDACCSCCSDCGYSECECDSYYGGSGNDSEDCERVTSYVPGIPSGTRTFGVELEIIGVGTNRAAAALAVNGLHCNSFGYTHSHTHDWKSVTDSSVYRGCEVVSPILCGSDGFAQVETATLALIGNGATVDSSCGTHVHIGCEDLTAREIARVAKLYDSHHGLIDMLHAPSRRGSAEWSGPHSSDHEKEQLDSLEKTDSKSGLSSFPRYRSVNLTAYDKYGTIEFRQHAGTLNARKLEAWVRFLFALIEHARVWDGRVHATLGGLLLALRQHGLSESDATYLSERAKDLASI